MGFQTPDFPPTAHSNGDTDLSTQEGGGSTTPGGHTKTPTSTTVQTPSTGQNHFRNGVESHILGGRGYAAGAESETTAGSPAGRSQPIRGRDSTNGFVDAGDISAAVEIESVNSHHTGAAVNGGSSNDGGVGGGYEGNGISGGVVGDEEEVAWLCKICGGG